MSGLERTVILLVLLVWNLNGSLSARCTTRSCFHFSTTAAATWEDAERSCRQQDMQLADADEELEAVLWASSDLAGMSFWTDQSDSLKWRWEDSTVSIGSEPITFSHEHTRCGTLKWDALRSTYVIGQEACSTKHGMLCETDYPLECTVSKTGREYKGTQSTSQSIINCAPWVGDNRYLDGRWTFPDEHPAQAKNHCRNPDNSPLGPWCGLYSHIANARDFCSIPSCVTSAHCFSASEVSPDQVWCVADKCYVWLPQPTSGAQSWLAADSCCQSFRTGRLASVSSIHRDMLLSKFTPGGTTLWIGLSNRDWNAADSPQPTLNLCPYINRGFTSPSSSQCNEKKSYVCREDAVAPPPTPPPPPATPPPTTTTRRPVIITTPTTTTTRKPAPRIITPAAATTRKPQPPITPPPPTTTTTTTSTTTTTTPPSTPSSTPAPSLSVSPSTLSTTRNTEQAVAQHLITGHNVVYLGIGLSATIVIIVVFLIVVLLALRRSKKRPFISRQRSSSGTQTFQNGDFDQEYIVGAPNNGLVVASTPTTTTSPTRTGVVVGVVSVGTNVGAGTTARTTSTGTGADTSTRSRSSKTVLERQLSTDSATQTDMTPPFTTASRQTLPLPLPPKENVYNVIYDRPRPTNCRPK